MQIHTRTHHADTHTHTHINADSHSYKHTHSTSPNTHTHNYIHNVKQTYFSYVSYLTARVNTPTPVHTSVVIVVEILFLIRLGSLLGGGGGVRLRYTI